MVEEILDQEPDAVKQHVEEQGLDADLRKMIRVEEENENREELLLWLLQKQKRHEMITDEERVQELLSHLEYAYRTAAISKETYRQVKQRNQELVNEVN